MTFVCNACDQEMQGKDLVACVADGKNFYRYCRECRRPKAVIHDVFFDGKPEINLADDPRTNAPIVFSGKAEKARYLAERGLREAGDKIHGAFSSGLDRPPRADSKHEVRMALKRVKEMGAFNRRQEFLRITQEGRRATQKTQW